MEIKATVLALTASFGVFGVTLGLSNLSPSSGGADLNPGAPTNAVPPNAATGLKAEVNQGYRLFEHNCAHCHGDDARGDEGPDLHSLSKSDSRLNTDIKAGIKGEMPAFGRKFNDAGVRALIAYLRTLKD